MFVGRHTHEDIVALLRRQIEEQTTDLRSARKEIKRLTDVIIHLKDEGKVLGPEHSDERWGRYEMSDYERGEAPAPQGTPSVFNDGGSSVLDAELEAEMNRAWNEE